MKKLMIDMDNVITDGSFLKHYEDFYDKKINMDEIKNYNFYETTTNYDKAFWDYMLDKNMYEDALLLPDCYRVLEKLNQKYDLYIVTSYVTDIVNDISANLLKDKYEYLKNKLPFIGPEKYVFISDKSLMKFDIAIDDRVKNLNTADTKILFTAWHNKEISPIELKKENIIRVNNWLDIESILLGDNNLQ